MKNKQPAKKKISPYNNDRSNPKSNLVIPQEVVNKGKITPIVESIKESRDFFLSEESINQLSMDNVPKHKSDKDLIYFMHHIGVVKFLNEKYELNNNYCDIAKLLCVFIQMDVKNTARTLRGFNHKTTLTEIDGKKIKVENKNKATPGTKEWINQVFIALGIKQPRKQRTKGDNSPLE